MTKEGDVDDTTIVTCNTCEKTFSGFSSDQASGCDATASIKENETVSVYCGYGSNHDLMIFTFAPQTFPKGNVCDACIKEGVLDGNLLKIESYAGDIPESKSHLDRIKDAFPDISGHQLIDIMSKSEKGKPNATSPQSYRSRLRNLLHK